MPVQDAGFDISSCTPGIVIGNNGRTANYAIAESTSTIHAHALLNTGFTHGKVSDYCCTR